MSQFFPKRISELASVDLDFDAETPEKQSKIKKYVNYFIPKKNLFIIW